MISPGNTFKSAWLTDPKKIEILDKPFPALGCRDVKVKIKACGICGTDIHFYRDYPEKKPTPLGHEVAGIVEETGAEVKNVKAGDHVVVQNNVACGTCVQCLNQNPRACTGIYSYMDDRSGIAEYITVPDTMVISYNKNGLDFAEATLAEPITVALDLWRESNFTLGDDVLIIGPGIIGLSLVKLAVKSGSRRVVMAGRDFESPRGASRKKAAEALGASLCIDTSDSGWKDTLREKFPRGFSKVIVTAPPVMISHGIEMAAFGGDIIYDGISFSDDQLTISANELHFEKKHLKPSHAIPNWGFPIALDLLQDGDIPRSCF